MSEDIHYYFAYGSNMNPDRMAERDLAFLSAESGHLHDYRMKFNKLSRSSGPAGSGVANIVREEGALTEGVVYRLASPGQITNMDRHEGCLGPADHRNHYDRMPLPIQLPDGGAGARLVTAWVYIAADGFIRDGLAPGRSYLNHLLAGGRFLSDGYLLGLQQTVCHGEAGQQCSEQCSGESAGQGATVTRHTLSATMSATITPGGT